MNKIKPEEEIQDEETRIRRENEENYILKGYFRFAKERYKICMECEAFSKIVKACGECYCFMPAKVIIKSTSCPVGKWGAVDEQESNTIPP
jgi:hypothetical protein